MPACLQRITKQPTKSGGNSQSMFIRKGSGFAIVLFAFIISIFFSLVFSNTAISANSSLMKLKKHDPTLLITVDTVLQKKAQNKDIVIIDVRQSEDYKKIKIPESLNIPLFAIKTKTFIRSKLLVIVNEGYNYGQLADECINLRKAGFKAYILYGGMYYWLQKGAPLGGNIAAGKSLNKVSPLIFLGEKDYSNWIIVDTSSSLSLSEPLAQRSTLITYAGNNDKFLKELDVTFKKINPDEFSLFMIIDEKGKSYEKIEAILEKTKFNKAFYLEGGKEALKKLLAAKAESEKERQSTGNKSKTCK
jgi:rhodanese-related sulfurtransferase